VETPGAFVHPASARRLGTRERGVRCYPAAVHPILFRVGGYEVTSYGLALTLAFAIGIWVAQRRGAARGLPPERILDVCMVILVTSLVGARLFYVVTHPELFSPPRGAWTDAFNPFQGGGRVGLVGLSMMGGVVLALAGGLLAMRWRGLPVGRTADVVVPSVALGEGITRIGCFLNGCCFGLACDWPWGVRFPADSAVAQLFPERALHPTQLYASLLGFAGFALLVWWDRRKPFDGAVFAAFLVLLPGARIAVDLVRWYEPQVILGRAGGLHFTMNQAVCLGLVAVGAGILWLGWRRARVPDAA